MINEQQMHGIWRLVSYLEQQADGRWADALGGHAHGTVGYWPNGRMQVVIAGSGRPRLRGEWSTVPAQDKAACLDLLVAYAGEWRVEGDRVIHRLTESWIPNWEGRELVRAVTFPKPQQVQFDTVNAAVNQRVVWERMP